MVQPVLEELAEFKTFSEKELEEMNILELAEKFKELNDELKYTENKIDDLMNKYEVLTNIAEKYGLVYIKKKEMFSNGDNYSPSIIGSA